jgi:hypothetical protein
VARWRIIPQRVGSRGLRVWECSPGGSSYVDRVYVVHGPERVIGVERDLRVPLLSRSTSIISFVSPLGWPTPTYGTGVYVVPCPERVLWVVVPPITGSGLIRVKRGLTRAPPGCGPDRPAPGVLTTSSTTSSSSSSSRWWKGSWPLSSSHTPTRTKGWGRKWWAFRIERPESRKGC